MKNYNLKSKVFYLFVFLTFTFSLLTFNLSEANAQQVNLSISPPLTEMLIKPGRAVLVAYTVQNGGDPTTVTARVLPFTARDNRGNVQLKREFDGPVRFDLDNASIRLEQPFFLEARKSEQLLLRIRVPEGAPEGDYYYTLLIETQPTPSSEGISVSRATATIGANLLVTVTDTGAIDVKAKVSKFVLIPRLKIPFLPESLHIYDSSDKIPILLEVANLGRNLIKPQGEVLLSGSFGEKSTYKVLSENILAQSSRVVIATPSAEVDCSKKSESGLCTDPPSVVLTGFFVGFYRVSSNITFGEGTPALFAADSFIAIPFKFALAAIASIIVAAFIIHRVKSIEKKGKDGVL